MRWPDDDGLSQIALSVLDAIKERPGIHFRGLARAADISSMGQLRHHVDQLQRKGYVFEIEDGRFKRYFVAGEQPAELRRAVTRFSRPVPRQIGRLLLRCPLSRGDLRRHLGCADSTLGYHLSRLTCLGEVVKTGTRSERRYALADPRVVRRALDVQDSDELERRAGALDRPSVEQEDQAPRLVQKA